MAIHEQKPEHDIEHDKAQARTITSTGDAPHGPARHAPAGATGRTVREALEEAGVSPEDFEER